MRPAKLLTILIFLCTCSGVPEIDEFDTGEWIADQYGCGYRLKSVRLLIDHKDQILGLDQLETVKLLGSANEHQLYRRSQKIFIYYLGNNEKCQNAVIKNQKLSIRFDALGRVNEVIILDD